MASQACLGGVPCKKCQRKKAKPDCVYLYQKHPATRSEDLETQSVSSEDDQAETEDSMSEGEGPEVGRDPYLPIPHAGFDGEFCLARCVDELKTVLANDGDAGHVSTLVPTTSFLHASTKDGNVAPDLHVPNPEQLLQTMGPQFFISPGTRSNLDTVGRLNLRYLAIRKLLQTGSVLQEWVALSMVIREVSLADLMCEDQERLPHNVELGRRFWWLLVDLDAQLSLLLGRRPATLSEPDIPRPSLATRPRQERCVRQNAYDYSSLVLKALEHFNPGRTGSYEASPETRKQMLEGFLTRLQELKTQLPQRRLRKFADTYVGLAAFDHLLELYVFEAIIHYRIARLAMESSSSASASASANETAASGGGRPDLPAQPTLKKPLAKFVQAIRQVLDHFECMCARFGDLATSSWPRCHRLYCAAIALAMCPRRAADTGADAVRLGKALMIFKGVPTDSPGSAIAECAFTNLIQPLARLRRVVGLSRNGDDAFANVQYCWSSILGQMPAPLDLASGNMSSMSFIPPPVWPQASADEYAVPPASTPSYPYLPGVTSSPDASDHVPPAAPQLYPYSPGVTSSRDASEQAGSVATTEYNPTYPVSPAYSAGFLNPFQNGSPPLLQYPSPIASEFCNRSGIPGIPEMPENPFGFITYTPSTQGLSVCNTMLYDPNMQDLSGDIPMSHDPYTQGLSAYTQIPAHNPNNSQGLHMYHNAIPAHDPNLQGLSAHTQIPAHDPNLQGLSAHIQIPTHNPNSQGLPVYHNAIPTHDPNPQGLPLYHNTISMQQPWWPASGNNGVATMPDIPLTLPPSGPQTAVHQYPTWHA
ncbi:hypothetical protein LTR92_009808 [Exophiala xenobiotica]|nr:hypothetical protein LTR92_009808 [Exophiala xenobiotica]KAK5351224.1 hypothetical protein LTR61_005578 [Exophiala xenobiotica]